MLYLSLFVCVWKPVKIQRKIKGGGDSAPWREKKKRYTKELRKWEVFKSIEFLRSPANIYCDSLSWENTLFFCWLCLISWNPDTTDPAMRTSRTARSTGWTPQFPSTHMCTLPRPHVTWTHPTVDRRPSREDRARGLRPRGYRTGKGLSPLLSHSKSKQGTQGHCPSFTFYLFIFTFFLGFVNLLMNEWMRRSTI